MSKSLIAAASVAAAFLAVCGSGSAGSAQPHAQASFHWRLITSNLSSPLHAAAPRSDPTHLYVVEQDGRILTLVKGRVLAQPFLDIRSLVLSGGEQGLLSVAFHPNYAKNRLLYVDYTDKPNGNTRVVQYKANKAGTRVLAGSRHQLFRVGQPYANHNGGQLAFGPDGYLYIGMGDGGSGGDPQNHAQNLSSRLGKLLKINATKRGAKPHIVGLGLRNPWRFSFDRSTGDLYIADVGQDTWEEVDYVRRKHPALMNFGWSVYEGRARYSQDRTLNPHGKVVWPVHVYRHGAEGCSVTGGFVYRGQAVPSARGLYFFGDYCSGRVWTFRIRSGHATGVRQLGQRISGLSSFGEDARGELYAVSLEGRLYRLTSG